MAIRNFYVSLAMRKLITIIMLACLCGPAVAQERTPSDVFWEKLKKHCGQSYEGQLAAGIEPGDFGGQRLVIHVRACDDDTIRIPFFVGDDRSRTWVLTRPDGVVKLKHDHRHADGTEEEVTQYGGTSTNTGFDSLQVFPADAETAALIPYAAGNVWWITVDDTSFTYNLRRIGTDRLFTVVFDLTKPVATPEAPWGWVD